MKQRAIEAIATKDACVEELERVRDEVTFIRSENKKLEREACQATLLRSELDDANERVERVRAELDRVRKNAHEAEFARSELEALRKRECAHQEEQAALRARYDELINDLKTKNVEDRVLDRQTIDKLRERVAAFEQSQANAANRGRGYERELMTLLADMFPFADVVDTSGKSHSMDVHVKFVGALFGDEPVTIAIDAKKYTKKLTQSEITKFERDHSENRFRHSILFVSSDIAAVAKTSMKLIDSNLYARNKSQHVVTNGDRAALLQSIVYGLRPVHENIAVDRNVGGINRFLASLEPVLRMTNDFVKSVKKLASEYRPGPVMSALREAASELQQESCGYIRTEQILQTVGANAHTKKRARTSATLNECQ